MSDLTPEQLDRLEVAHRALDRGNGAARARLVAALTAEAPPQGRSFEKARFEAMRRYGIRTAIAAAICVAIGLVWQAAAARSLFADTVRAMLDAKGFRCDLVMVEPGHEGNENTNLGGHIFWSANGDERLEMTPEDTVRIFRPGQNGVVLRTGAKTYEVVDKSIAREFSFGLFGGLSRHKGSAESKLGRKEIRGKAAEGFVIPWSTATGSDERANAKVAVWLDAETSLPVRVDLRGMGPQPGFVVRLENFQWGEHDPSLFDTSVPEGYAKADGPSETIDDITEYVVYGLSVYAKYNDGKYPQVRFVYGDEQGEALRGLIGVGKDAQGWVKLDKNLKWNDPKEGEFAFGSSGMTWINHLQRTAPECVYNGKTVTRKDADKVLLRWKRDDGRYRVIFGDLKSSDVTAERLKELEAR